MVAAYVDDQPVAVGSHQPVGNMSEVVGVATLPAYRSRRIAAVLMDMPVEDAGRRGVQTVFLSAGDVAVARVYEQLGFWRLATACVAEAPSASRATPPTGRRSAPLSSVGLLLCPGSTGRRGQRRCPPGTPGTQAASHDARLTTARAGRLPQGQRSVIPLEGAGLLLDLERRDMLEVESRPVWTYHRGAGLGQARSSSHRKQHELRVSTRTGWPAGPAR
jgi:hypothetical protein